MKRIVIKLSGQVFGADGRISLKDYAAVIIRAASVCQPVIVAGGGEIARHYIGVARAAGADESTLDELGIEISRLNARLLISALGARAYPHPPTSLQEAGLAVDSGSVVVMGGLYPGQSTNGTAALVAERVGAAEFLNATDVDGVYDRDPNEYEAARRLDEIRLEDLKGMMMRKEAAAGGHDLMDMVALMTIERSRIKTRVISSEIETLEHAIRGGAAGTTILLPESS